MSFLSRLLNPRTGQAIANNATRSEGVQVALQAVRDGRTVVINSRTPNGETQTIVLSPNSTEQQVLAALSPRPVAGAEAPPVGQGQQPPTAETTLNRVGQGARSVNEVDTLAQKGGKRLDQAGGYFGDQDPPDMSDGL